MGGLLGGGDEPQTPILAPAPEPFKFGSFKSLLKNLEVIQTTGADGREHLVEREIELDPVAKAFVDQAKKRLGGLVTDIMAVSRENPRLVAPFQGFINEVSQLNDQDLADWTNTVRPEDFTNFKQQLTQLNTTLNNEKWDDFDHQLEIDLAARGLSNSTVGDTRRALSMRNRQISNNQIGLDSEIVGDQLVNTDMARKTTMYQGRNASRNRSADIAGQRYGLEQGEVDRGLMERDDRMNKLMQVLGMNQNIVNQDTNIKQGSTLLPTVLGAQDAITGRQQSAWAQQTQNQLSQYNIENQRYAADQAASGSMMNGLLSLGGTLASAYMTGGASLGAPTIGAKVVGQMRQRMGQ